MAGPPNPFAPSSLQTALESIRTAATVLEGLEGGTQLHRNTAEIIRHAADCLGSGNLAAGAAKLALVDVNNLAMVVTLGAVGAQVNSAEFDPNDLVYLAFNVGYFVGMVDRVRKTAATGGHGKHAEDNSIKAEIREWFFGERALRSGKFKKVAAFDEAVKLKRWPGITPELVSKAIKEPRKKTPA